MNNASTAAITLDDIRHLSDEVRLLVRAGLPLEHHLASAGRSHSRQLEQLTTSISESLRRGEDLQSVIGRDQSAASRMLAAAVSAGVQSGDLATTVEMMGDLAGDLIELRKQIIDAITYPLIVLAVAWILFTTFVLSSLENIYHASQDLGVQFPPFLNASLALVTEHPAVLFVVPALAVLVVAYWLISGRASSMAFRGPERLLLLFPGVGALIRDLRFYTLTRMLALLIERQMPLPEALLIAGASTGSGRLDSACQQTAEAVRNGRAAGMEVHSKWRRGQLPPLLQVCLKQTATDGQRLVLRMRAVTQHYRARLDFNAAWLRLVMPVVLFIVIAGGTAALYAASVFWPVVEIYRQLGETV